MQAHGVSFVKQDGTVAQMYGAEAFANKFALDSPAVFDLSAGYTTSSAFAVALYKYTYGADGVGNGLFPVFLSPGDWLSGTGRVTAHGSLASGVYDVAAYNSSQAGYSAQDPDRASSTFEFSFDLSDGSGPAPIPEPSSVLLVATGAAFVRRRRTGRKEHAHGEQGNS
jgi:hypothetical protein